MTDHQGDVTNAYVKASEEKDLDDLLYILYDMVIDHNTLTEVGVKYKQERELMNRLYWVNQTGSG